MNMAAKKNTSGLLGTPIGIPTPVRMTVKQPMPSTADAIKAALAPKVEAPAPAPVEVPMTAVEIGAALVNEAWAENASLRAELSEARLYVNRLLEAQAHRPAVEPKTEPKVEARPKGRTKAASGSPKIVISVVGDRFVVKAPYSPASTDAWRRIPGRQWSKTDKVNSVPVSEREALWSLLRRFHSGEPAIGPKGPFTVKGEE